MANLEERIAHWRRACAEAMGGSAETLEELEGHLREEVGRRIASGAAMDDAFNAAVERLGQPAALAAEFARGTPAPWLPVRLALILLIAVAGGLLAKLTPWLGDNHGPLLALHVIAVTVGYVVTLAIGTLAACYVMARPFGMPGPQQLQSLLVATRRLTAAALIATAIGVVLGGVWAQEHLGRYWGWDAKEVGGLSVVLWDALMLVVIGKRLLGDHAMLLLGLGGSTVVALAWFGPRLLGTGLHAYEWPTTALPLALFVMAHGVFACLGFIPAGALRRQRNVAS
jgi:hypothetical protein